MNRVSTKELKEVQRQLDEWIGDESVRDKRAIRTYLILLDLLKNNGVASIKMEKLGGLYGKQHRQVAAAHSRNKIRS